MSQVDTFSWRKGTKYNALYVFAHVKRELEICLVGSEDMLKLCSKWVAPINPLFREQDETACNNILEQLLLKRNFSPMGIRKPTTSSLCGQPWLYFSSKECPIILLKNL